ncbi:MAG: MBL fold metallo-hydrolase [Gammaproteobacteria bacterium]|nr:MBL fold metallo-hydrolase [Gammaproteobacteria bacterium]
MANNHISDYRQPDYDKEKQVLLYDHEDHEIYWLGIQEHTAFRSNIYLIKSGDQAIIVDPGHRAYFKKIYQQVEQIIDPSLVCGLILCHQDPDVAASMPDWLTVNPELQVLTSPRTQVLLPYYGTSNYAWHDVVEEPFFTFSNGKRLRFIEAPFLHFSGAFTTYDITSSFLMSGDVWAAIQLEWSLVVDNFEEHKTVLDLFHVDYMASNIACRGLVEKLRTLQINAILPQHGSIIDSSDVPAALAYLETLVCGTDIIYPHITS